MAKPATPPPAKKPPAAKPAEDPKRAAERAAMAASRVADLAKNVASDVGDHAAKMKAISADLAGIDRESDGANAAVFSAMDQMLAANTELQQRLEQAEKQLAVQAVEIKTHESEARTDSLTGLSNRRAFDDELKRRLGEWQRKGTPCTLVLMDIDFFKKFNDTHGHQVGDEVLRQVAKVLDETVARDGHSLPLRRRRIRRDFARHRRDQACKVAERIRAAIEAVDDHLRRQNAESHLQPGRLDIPGRRRRRPPDPPSRRRALHFEKSRPQLRPLAHRRKRKFRSQKQAKYRSSSRLLRRNRDRDRRSSSSAPSGATFIQMLKRRVTESHRFGVPISILYLKIEDYDIISRKYGSPIARQMVDTAMPALEKDASRNGCPGQARKRRIRRHAPGQHANRSKSRGKTHVFSDRKLPAAARRSRTADSLAARHRRAQTETKRPKNSSPAHGQRIDRAVPQRPANCLTVWRSQPFVWLASSREWYDSAASFEKSRPQSNRIMPDPDTSPTRFSRRSVAAAPLPIQSRVAPDCRRRRWRFSWDSPSHFATSSGRYAVRQRVLRPADAIRDCCHLWPRRHPSICDRCAWFPG